MDKKDLISLYASASPELRTALEKEFGKSFLVSIETVHDAYKYLDLEEDTNLWLDKGYLKRVKAFYELSILCDAWNKADDFVPDFDDPCMGSWVPLFSLDGRGFSHSNYVPSPTLAVVGSRFCFKSKQRSDEFGEKFEGLFKILLRG